MALSRAAAKAARQAAKSRGLQGNRGEDGSMLTGPSNTHWLEEFGGQEKYPDVDETTTPAQIQAELNKLNEDIEEFEVRLQEEMEDIDEADPYSNEFTTGLIETQLRILNNRKALLEDILNRGYEAATEVSF